MKAAAYGGYVGEVEEAELQRYFFLDDEDRSHIDRRRREANRDRARSAERAIWGSDSNGAESHAKGRSPDSLAVADRPVGRRSRSGTSHMD